MYRQKHVLHLVREMHCAKCLEKKEERALVSMALVKSDSVILLICKLSS